MVRPTGAYQSEMPVWMGTSWRAAPMSSKKNMAAYGRPIPAPRSILTRHLSPPDTDGEPLSPCVDVSTTEPPWIQPLIISPAASIVEKAK